MRKAKGKKEECSFDKSKEALKGFRKKSINRIKKRRERLYMNE